MEAKADAMVSGGVRPADGSECATGQIVIRIDDAAVTVLIDQDWRPLSQVDDWWQGDIKLSGAKATVIAQMQGQDDYVGMLRFSIE